MSIPSSLESCSDSSNKLNSEVSSVRSDTPAVANYVKSRKEVSLNQIFSVVFSSLTIRCSGSRQHSSEKFWHFSIQPSKSRSWRFLHQSFMGSSSFSGTAAGEVPTFLVSWLTIWWSNYSWQCSTRNLDCPLPISIRIVINPRLPGLVWSSQNSFTVSMGIGGFDHCQVFL